MLPHSQWVPSRAEERADSIIAAGLRVIGSDTSQQSLKLGDMAVENAIRGLFIEYAGESKTPVSDALTVIAQRYVREKATK